MSDDEEVRKLYRVMVIDQFAGNSQQKMTFNILCETELVQVLIMYNLINRKLVINCCNRLKFEHTCSMKHGNGILPFSFFYEPLRLKFEISVDSKKKKFVLDV